MYGDKKQASQYRGVTVSPKGYYNAQIWVKQDRVYAGSWRTERKAAIARDRLVLFYGVERPLNFPKLSAKLGPASAAELREQALREGKKTAAHRSSRYFGVGYRESEDKWLARVGRPDRVIGLFATERLAALAHDRVARWENPNAPTNFKKLELPPAPFEEVQAWRHQLSKQSHGRASSYRGVYAHHDKWGAQLSVPGKGKFKLGPYSREKAAALARDRAIVFYDLSASLMNFPEQWDKLEPASIEALQVEARAKQQGAGSNKQRYRGVTFMRRRMNWMATFQHQGSRHHLGYYDDPAEAARAYDEKAIEVLGKAKARLNFHPVTGERLYGARVPDED